MSDVDKAVLQAGQTVNITRQLETLLAEWGAVGKGLHEKANSVEHLLTERLMKRFRYVASVRNKLMHNDVELSDVEFSAFLRSANELISELRDYRPARQGAAPAPTPARPAAPTCRPAPAAAAAPASRPAPAPLPRTLGWSSRFIALGIAALLGSLGILGYSAFTTPSPQEPARIPAAKSKAAPNQKSPKPATKSAAPAAAKAAPQERKQAEPPKAQTKQESTTEVRPGADAELSLDEVRDLTRGL